MMILFILMVLAGAFLVLVSANLIFISSDVTFTDSSSVNSVTGASLILEVDVTVGVRKFPGALPATSDVNGNSNTKPVITTATIDQYTNQIFLRARGRQMNFKIESDGIGVQWQLGYPRVDIREDGKR